MWLEAAVSVSERRGVRRERVRTGDYRRDSGVSPLSQRRPVMMQQQGNSRSRWFLPGAAAACSYTDRSTLRTAHWTGCIATPRPIRGRAANWSHRRIIWPISAWDMSERDRGSYDVMKLWRNDGMEASRYRGNRLSVTVRGSHQEG